MSKKRRSYPMGGNPGRAKEKTDMSSGKPCHKRRGSGVGSKPKGQSY